VFGVLAYVLYQVYQARQTANANAYLSTETAASLPVYSDTDPAAVILASYYAGLQPETTTQTPSAAASATTPSTATTAGPNAIPQA
jgi:hypothetical protein